MDKEIIKFIYIIAMKDATLRRAYSGKNKKTLTDITKYPKIENGLINFIDKIMGNKYKRQEDYDKDFLELANTICNEINQGNNNGAFKFGNAQKLINMTIKYLYIWGYKNANVKQCFKYCHCPMDNKMLEDVWKNRHSLNTVKLGKFNSFITSWGKEEFNPENSCKTLPKRYSKFQEAVKELSKMNNVSSLEYDYLIWK